MLSHFPMRLHSSREASIFGDMFPGRDNTPSLKAIWPSSQTNQAFFFSHSRLQFITGETSHAPMAHESQPSHKKQSHGLEGWRPNALPPS